MARALLHGWNRDRKDERDWQFKDVRPRAMHLPPSAGVDGLEPDIWDQEQLGSCTGHGTLRAVAIERVKLLMVPQPLPLSRLMAYLLGRTAEGNLKTDAGAEIRDVIKGLARAGCCREELWPYLIDKFADLPPSDCWTDALAHTVKAYSSIDNSSLTQLKSCLVDHEAFVFGFDVPPSFESDEVAQTGILPDPEPGWTSLGGHCVCGVRYDDAFRGANWKRPGGFMITNSWGDQWGDKGHVWFSYDFISSQACDSFWHLSSLGYGPSAQPDN